MNEESKETASYGPLYSDVRLSLSSGSIHDYDSKDGLLPRLYRFREGSSHWRTVLKVLAVASGVANLVFLGLIVVLTGSKPTQCQCTDVECAAKTSFYSPLLEPDSNAIEYEVVVFGGALEYESVYKGTPNEKLDDAWTWITHMNNSGVDGEVVDRIGKSRIAVKYAEEQGGMYDVGVEVFHQLHCLVSLYSAPMSPYLGLGEVHRNGQNLIRKYTYRTYYDLPENKPTEFTDSEPVLRSHVDHCIDMLRQVLMCQADVGIVTYNWVEGWADAYPDFSTQHKCRKFDRIVAWADQHSTPVEDPTVGPDSVFLPRPPP
ncbi:hypothetical protein F5B20DRAFT_432849 [Whalleya microplaca]|nr:hypothetical protein F5B20DRAFT_432849 [Whalleya microplaca]